MQEFAWALQPLAAAVTSQPIHQNSLFGIVEKLLPDSPEGLIWMTVYDLKALMQLLEYTSSHLLFSIVVFICNCSMWARMSCLHGASARIKP